MDSKTLRILEYPKILDKLASYAAFAPSADLARRLRPTSDLREARRRLALTEEARTLLAASDLSIGGARDLRPILEKARRSAMLEPHELLDIKSTLVAARNLARTFERLESAYPLLADLAAQIPPPLGLIDAISRTISERGEVLDSASPALGRIRRDLQTVHDRLMSRLQRLISDPKVTPYLQDALVTMRGGRYVIPLQADFKGRIKAIVHDQSASGATLFVEPLSVVEFNNQYRELQLAERDEVRRVLTALSQRITENAPELQHMLEVVARLDVTFAAARYAETLKASPPGLRAIRPRKGRAHPGSVIRLREARHPLLDPESVVPIDVELDPRTYALVITGPNTGGKTVALKTVGLLTLMAQSGLHIPAGRGSELSVFRSVFADIGDEQSIEQSLSTFSGHITNINRILKRAGKRSLVILDELGAGTDPQEGAALARAILAYLLGRSVTTLVTTHHPELKTYAHNTPGVVNASVEFDLETLRPTYRLTIGLPGRSNALAIAQRLGMPQEIIEAARAELHPDEVRAEGLLDEIHRQRQEARQARAEAEAALQEAEALRAELAARLERIEDERRAVLEAARKEAETQLETLRAEIRALRRQLGRARQPLEVIEQVQERLEEVEEEHLPPVERRPAPAPAGAPPPAGPLRLGARVFIPRLGAKGVVTAMGEDEAEVQMGALRMRVRLSDLQAAGEPVSPEEEALPEASAAASAPSAPESGLAPSPGVELDLRGRRVDEALEELDRYLDAAYLANLPWVRIIHGRGTGRVRAAVRDALQRHPHVVSWEPGGEGEGGDGVSVAKLGE
ncbi:MAG TPA: endonuclease MutS2 [Chloroflexi bacterium]|nr:endonuclease MutS2 [Chloroflexota bacterium]